MEEKERTVRAMEEEEAIAGVVVVRDLVGIEETLVKE